MPCGLVAFRPCSREEGRGRGEEGGRRKEAFRSQRRSRALSEVQNHEFLQAGPERASEHPIWGDLGAFGGRRRPQALLEVQSHEFAGRPGKGLRTTDLGRFGGILGPGAPTCPFGGPKSRVCGQARKRASEQPIWGDLEAFWGRKRPQALLEVRNHELAGRPGKGIRTADLERFGGISGRKRPYPFGGPKSLVCRQARKGSQNSGFYAIWGDFGAGKSLVGVWPGA